MHKTREEIQNEKNEKKKKSDTHDKEVSEFFNIRRPMEQMETNLKNPLLYLEIL